VILVVLFLYLFMPPLKVPIYHIFFICSLVYIFFNSGNIFKYKKKKIIYWNSMHIIIIIMYSFLIIVLSNRQLSNINTNIISFIEVPTIAFAITIYLRNNKKKFDDLIKSCILVSIYQSILSLICFMFPKLQEFFVENFVFLKMDEVQKKNLRWLMERRLYGVSNGLTYSTPIYQSIISIICCMYFKIEKKYFIYFLLVLFSAVINARIGAIVFIVGFIIIIFKKSNLEKIKYLFLIFIMGIIVLILLINFEENNTVKWILDSIEEIKQLFNGKKIGTFAILFGEDFLRTPNGINLIFGTGETIFLKKHGSDIGYINDLWYGGIVYTMILWSFFIQNFLALFYSKMESKFLNIKVLSLILFIISIISHVKGTFYAPSSYWNFIVLICVFNMVEKNRKGR